MFVSKRKYDQLWDTFGKVLSERDVFDDRITDLETRLNSKHGKYARKVQECQQLEVRLALAEAYQERFDGLETSVEGVSRSAIYSHGEIMNLLKESTDVKLLAAARARDAELAEQLRAAHKESADKTQQVASHAAIIEKLEAEVDRLEGQREELTGRYLAAENERVRLAGELDAMHALASTVADAVKKFAGVA